MRNLINNTVFNPISATWHPDKVLAVLFHRSAATFYLVYFLWWISSFFFTLPSLTLAQNYTVRVAFSFLIVPLALLAFLGAVYFPKLARLEMYTASALVTLILIYEIFILFNFLNANLPDGLTFLITLSHLIIPTTRVIFIYVTLIKQAGGKQ